MMITWACTDEEATTPSAAPESSPRAENRNSLLLLEPDTGDIGIRIPVPPGTSDLDEPDVEIGEGAVWAHLTGCLCRLDPGTGELDQVPPGGQGTRMAVGLGTVWLSGRFLTGFDPESLSARVEAELFPTEPIFTVAVATTTDAVWVGFQHDLQEIDHRTGNKGKSVELDASIDGIVGTVQDLYVVDAFAKTLSRFSTAKARVTQTIELDVTPDDVIVDEDGTLWVLSGSDGALTKVDPSGDVGGPIPVGTNPSDVAAGPGAVWVSDEEEGLVTQVDAAAGVVTQTVDVGGPAQALAVDPETGDVWVYVA